MLTIFQLNNVTWIFFNFNSDDPIDRKAAFGRIAFAVPYDTQPEINQLILNNKQSILTPLTSLATPGKTTVRVIILADPNDLEICFVDDEGFTKLSEVDPDGEAELDKNIRLDPFQKSWDRGNSLKGNVIEKKRKFN